MSITRSLSAVAVLLAVAVSGSARPEAPKVLALLKERRDLLAQAFAEFAEAIPRLFGTPRELKEPLLANLADLSRQLLEAELALAGGPAEARAARQAHVERLRAAERIEERRNDQLQAAQKEFGREAPLSRPVKACRLAAEIALLRDGASPKAALSNEQARKVQAALGQWREVIRANLQQNFTDGRIDHRSSVRLARALREAERVEALTANERRAACRFYLKCMQTQEEAERNRLSIGRSVDAVDLLCATSTRLEAEVELQRELTPAAAGASPRIRALLKERRDVMREAYRLAFEAREVRLGSNEVDFARERLEVELAAADSHADRMAAYRWYLDYKTTSERREKAKFMAGRSGRQPQLERRSEALQAEVWLVREETPRDRPRLRALLKEHREMLQTLTEFYRVMVAGAQDTMEGLLRLEQRLFQTDLELASSPAEQRNAHEAHVESLVALKAYLKQRGGLDAEGYSLRAVELARLQAEIDLLRLQTR
jgi:hypothetical protein